MKPALREQAINLRREGKSYSEIRSQVLVAKSTLSEWFKLVELTFPQKQRITQKRLDAATRGAKAKRERRIAEVQHYIHNGKKQIGSLSKQDLFLIGTTLYWAEGSKQNTRSPSTGIIFGNSDYRMLLIFIEWLKQLGITEEEIRFELYVHMDRRADIPAFQQWWSEKIRIPLGKINKVYLKRGNPKTKRSNVGDLYHGLLRIKVSSSTILNRRVNGWVEGIVASLGSGVIGNTSAFGAEDSRIVP